MNDFGTDKHWLGQVLSLSQDALHIHVGLLVFFAAHLVFRRRLGDVLPVLLVLAISVFGEALDMARLADQGVFAPWASVHDILNTTFWPAVLTTGFRIWRADAADCDPGGPRSGGSRDRDTGHPASEAPPA